MVIFEIFASLCGWFSHVSTSVMYTFAATCTHTHNVEPRNVTMVIIIVRAERVMYMIFEKEFRCDAILFHAAPISVLFLSLRSSIPSVCLCTMCVCLVSFWCIVTHFTHAQNLFWLFSSLGQHVVQLNLCWLGLVRPPFSLNMQIDIEAHQYVRHLLRRRTFVFSTATATVVVVMRMLDKIIRFLH